MATRSSRAGPTAFLAADNKASSTAATRTSRLMPFSRSQNSNTAKKSAFILFVRTFDPIRGTKKSADLALPTLAGWANQRSSTVRNAKNSALGNDSQASNPDNSGGVNIIKPFPNIEGELLMLI